MVMPKITWYLLVELIAPVALGMKVPVLLSVKVVELVQVLFQNTWLIYKICQRGNPLAFYKEYI